MFVGNGFGLDLGSSGGTFLNMENQDYTVWPRLGVEMGGKIVLSTNSDKETYYHWTPGLSVGPQLKVAGCSLYPSIMGGVGIGNFGKYGILPRFDLLYGPGAYLSCGENGVSYSHKIMGVGDHYFQSLEMTVGAFHMKLERNKGFRTEKSLLFMVNITELIE